ncbi:hypothetical protein CK203_055094 [Vitis vinifera]|uniref:Uncharacterized protein n=1 Tax=Vitis vinifera TaxID=29760 RepID=A0A438GUC6_VITVI|nr:hypothetical protein CK203_055094 [Vitis vinifera]
MKQDRSRKCAYHKNHGHTMKQCRSLHYLVERLIRSRHLEQYIHSDGKCRETTRNPNDQVPMDSAALRVGAGQFYLTRFAKRYAHGGRHNHLSSSRSELGNSTDLLQMSTYGQMGLLSSILENPGRILFEFNRVSITSLGDVVLLVQAGPVTQNVQFSMVEDLFPLNTIMGRTWLHGMKVIPSHIIK